MLADQGKKSEKPVKVNKMEEPLQFILDFHQILSHNLGYPRKTCFNTLPTTLEILKSLEIEFQKVLG